MNKTEGTGNSRYHKLGPCILCHYDSSCRVMELVSPSAVSSCLHAHSTSLFCKTCSSTVWPFCTCLGLQVRSEQLAEEHTELVALRHELNQRDRELSRRATEQATEAANTQVSIFALCWLRAACCLGLVSLCFVAAAAVSHLVA